MSENPYLSGNFGPVTDEVTAFDLRVTGELPRELRGRLLRIGPNPVEPPDPRTYHWFLGNGMVHGLRLRDGKAEWYRNRYVRTPYFENPSLSRISADGKVDRLASAANTHVVAHHGKILALEEGSFPWVVDGELAVRKVMQLSLSFDHRVVDGQQGSQFLADVGALLSDPAVAITY